MYDEKLGDDTGLCAMRLRYAAGVALYTTIWSRNGRQRTSHWGLCTTLDHLYSIIEYTSIIHANWSGTNYSSQDYMSACLWKEGLSPATFGEAHF
jgi:hypothetical protein